MSSTLSPDSAVCLNGRSYLHKDSVYLAYLPLAHIMELAVELSMFATGCKVGFGSPGTLASTSIKMLQTNPPQVTQPPPTIPPTLHPSHTHPRWNAALLTPTTFAVTRWVMLHCSNRQSSSPPPRCSTSC